MLKRALIRRIGLLLCRGWASILLIAGAMPSHLVPSPLPQTILIASTVIFPLISFIAVLQHLALFSSLLAYAISIAPVGVVKKGV